MQLSHADLAADLMHRVGHPVIPLARLASRLGVGAATLRGALERDPRFRIIETAPVLEPTLPYPPEAAAAYTDALRRVGLSGTRLVLLVDPLPLERAASTADLLRSSLATLVRAGAPEDTQQMAEAVVAVTGALGLPSPAAARSTTPPPPARRSAPDPPRWRRPSPPPLHGPGSHRE